MNRYPNTSSIDFGAALSYNEFAGNDFFPSKVSRFDDWTENFVLRKEWFMSEMFLLNVISGLIACVIWDGVKAVWRYMR